MVFGKSRHVGQEWARLQEVEAKHGKESREYSKALSRWIRCLKAEAAVATKRAYIAMEGMRAAGARVSRAKTLHGAGSKEYEKAVAEFKEAEERTAEAMRALEPIQRAALSIDI